MGRMIRLDKAEGRNRGIDSMDVWVGRKGQKERRREGNSHEGNGDESVKRDFLKGELICITVTLPLLSLLLPPLFFGYCSFCSSFISSPS